MNKPCKTWITLWFLTASLVLVVAIFNYIVDASGLRAHDETTYWSPAPLHTPWRDVQKQKPASIILGTSRAEFGYRANHPYLTQPAYNFATTYSSLHYSLRKLKWAIQQGTVSQVLLIADFGSFNIPIGPKDFQLTSIDSLLNLLSIQSLQQNISAIQLTQAPTPTTVQKADAFLSRIMAFGGHKLIMSEDEQSFFLRFNKNSRYLDSDIDPFDDLREILALCYENNIKLDIVFGPSHIRLWEALDIASGIEFFEDWKKEVVQTVYSAAHKRGKAPYRVFDFSVYHPLTAEPVPDARKQKMTYYLDSSHYSPVLGDIVLDRLNGTSKYDDFGVSLTPDNIEAHLKAEALKRPQFINTQAYKKSLLQKYK